jgi:peptide deformylase
MLVTENDVILKQIIEEYDFDICPVIDKAIVELMFTTMKTNNGIGLAAQQIGQNLRGFVMIINDEEFVCVNPVIIEQSEEMIISKEGCLSFPNLTLSVKRPAGISVSYKNETGIMQNRLFDGVYARCFCHELDHLNGITFDTKIAKTSLQLAKQKRTMFLKQQKRRK